jgi:hypothetical protein
MFAWWTTLASLPDRREHGYAGVLDGKIYFVSGRKGGFITQPDLFIYDLATDSWSSGASVIRSTSGHIVQVLGNRLYAMGGELVRDDTVLDINQVYDPVKDRWSEAATMPVGLHASANTVVGGSIYVFGGAAVVEASSLGRDTVYRFDPPAVRNPPPSSLRATLRARGAVLLKWKFKHKKSDATSLQVELKSKSSRRELINLATAKKKLLLTGLEAGVTYSFRVRSRGPSGRSAWSDTVTLTMPD